MMPTFKQLLKDPILLLAFGFGSGLAKKAPGTWGTVAAIPIYIVLVNIIPNVFAYALTTIVLFGIGIWICDEAEKRLGLHDPGNIVWDEIVGFLVTMTLLPPQWLWICAGFIVFRFFDIVKPWPIKWFDQRVSGGLGVMLDDVIAGIFACGVLHLVQYFWIDL